jgi:hypothetical protein
MADPTQSGSQSFTRKERSEGNDLHSARVPSATWDDAKARAAKEGIVMNRLIIELLEGYAHGVYKLPTTTVATTRTYPPQPGS